MEPPDPDYILRAIDGPATSLSFLYKHGKEGPDIGHHLVVGSQTGSLFVWNLHTRRIVHRLSAHTGSVLSITYLDASQEIISQGRDGQIHRWRLTAVDAWEKIDSFPCSDLGFSRAAVFQIDNKPVVAAPSGGQSEVTITELDTGQLVATPTPQDAAGMVMDIEATNEGSIAIGYEDGSVALWDARQPRCAVNRTKFHGEPVASVAYCVNTRRGLSGSVDGTLVAWNGDELKSSAGASVKGGVACVRGRRDGKLFAVGGCDSRIHIYSGGRKMTPLAKVCAHTQTVQCLAFNASDRTLAAGSRDKTISVWSLYKND